VVALSEAAGDGRLTLDEHAERVQRAYAARTLGDLVVLTSDLAAPAAQPLRLDSSRAVSAFFSRERRDGRWVVPDRLAVTAVGGQVVLDNRRIVGVDEDAILHEAQALAEELSALAGTRTRLDGRWSRGRTTAAALVV